MLRLSFIVPFYNVEPYIEECIRSLYNQDIPMEEYEVICVDDCSPDGSRAIVEQLQKEYPTLKLLIHAENKRQGGARNTGIREAKGKYIWFVDSDDYIKPNCLKSLLELVESGDLDLLKFYYEYVPVIFDNRKIVESPIITGTELIFDVDTGEENMQKCCTVWCQLIKRELIIEHNILFAENVQYEDDDYAYQLFAYANRTKLVGDKVYFVRDTPNSTTRRRNDLRRAMDLYAQVIRFTELIPKLSFLSRHWENLAKKRIKDEVNNQLIPILKECKISDRLTFWIKSINKVRKLKPYLGYKSYYKLRSFMALNILS